MIVAVQHLAKHALESQIGSISCQFGCRCVKELLELGIGSLSNDEDPSAMNRQTRQQQQQLVRSRIVIPSTIEALGRCRSWTLTLAGRRSRKSEPVKEFFTVFSPPNPRAEGPCQGTIAKGDPGDPSSRNNGPHDEELVLGPPEPVAIERLTAQLIKLRYACSTAPDQQVPIPRPTVRAFSNRASEGRP